MTRSWTSGPSDGGLTVNAPTSDLVTRLKVYVSRDADLAVYAFRSQVGLVLSNSIVDNGMYSQVSVRAGLAADFGAKKLASALISVPLGWKVGFSLESALPQSNVLRFATNSPESTVAVKVSSFTYATSSGVPSKYQVSWPSSIRVRDHLRVGVHAEIASLTTELTPRTLFGFKSDDDAFWLAYEKYIQALNEIYKGRGLPY